MYTTHTAQRIGRFLKAQLPKQRSRKFSYADVAHGMNVESEHGSKAGRLGNVTHDDPLTTFKIAWTHLKERPDYYALIRKLEKSPRLR